MPRNTTHPTERILGLFLDLPRAEQAAALLTLNVIHRRMMPGTQATQKVTKGPKPGTAFVPTPSPIDLKAVAQLAVPTPKAKSPRQSRKDRLAEAQAPVAELADPGLPPEEFGEPDAGDPVEG